MNRETKEIVTKSGKKVTVLSYLTGPEASQVKMAMYGDLTVKAPEEGEKMEAVKIPLSATVRREPKLLELAIVSVEGCSTKEASLEAINLLPSTEYDDLIKQIDTLHKGGTFPKAI